VSALFVLQVQLDVCGVGKNTISRFVVPLLGSWHPYKQACIVLHRNSHEWMAPLFHHFHPGNTFYFTGTSLSKLTYWLSLMRLSFPAWRDELEALLKNEAWRCKNKQHRKLFVYASNLWSLMNYFIPLVSLGGTISCPVFILFTLSCLCFNLDPVVFRCITMGASSKQERCQPSAKRKSDSWVCL
jgi:hypothetical protein